MNALQQGVSVAKTVIDVANAIVNPGAEGAEDPFNEQNFNPVPIIDAHINIGGINIGFKLSFMKEEGRENAPETGLQAEVDGQIMQGLLGEKPEQDQQRTFSENAWGKVKEHRALCAESAAKFANERQLVPYRGPVNEMKV